MPVKLPGSLIPLAATRLERVFRALFGVLLLVAMAATVTALAMRSRHVGAVVMGSVGSLALAGVAAALARRRSRRVLEEHQFRLCPRCLAGLTGNGRCTACGFEFGTAGDAEKIWRELYDAPAEGE